MARDAVFRSWNNDRAIYYRRQNGIPDDLGTAVNVQAMVFGNMGDTSGTGVGFTRNPSTGENHFYGEYLTNAQGEDVVAGVRTPLPIDEPRAGDAGGLSPAARDHLRGSRSTTATSRTSSSRSRTARLFLLQTRNGKRTAQAAVRIAVDMVKEKLITRAGGGAARRAGLARPAAAPAARPQGEAERASRRGLSASPGAAVGMAVFDADTAAEMGQQKKKRVILVRKETTPDDIHGMDAAQGILTATGGMTSHAAVVARGMGKPCVSGASAIHVDDQSRTMTVDERGGEGRRLDHASTVRPAASCSAPCPRSTPRSAVSSSSSWRSRDKFRRLKVRSNADIPRDAIKAREFGAEGIGLCRTEHMFFAEDRLPQRRAHDHGSAAVKERRVELEARTGRSSRALRRRSRAGERGRPGSSVAKHQKAVTALKHEIAGLQKELAVQTKAYHGALAKLLPFQRGDFYGLFKAMDGYPVTIRTLDPPLHEFLPKRESSWWTSRVFPRATAAHKKEMAKRYRLTVAQLKTGMPELLRRVEEPARVQPHARAPRLPARHHLPGDHRDAGARDLRGGLRDREGQGRQRSCPRS